MSLPDEPRPPKAWPLAAITVLVLLLAGFLVIRISRRQDGPATVKDPPPVLPSPPAAPVPPSTVASSEIPPGPGAAPASEIGLKLVELRKLLDQKQWDAAHSLLDEARKLQAESVELKSLAEALDAGRKKDQADRDEVARRAAEKRRQDQAFALLKEAVEKLREQDSWDAAIGALEEFAQAFPDARQDEVFRKLDVDVRDRRREVLGLFNKVMDDAKKAFDEGRYPAAIAVAENAYKCYPERKPAVREFQDRCREFLAAQGMVRIPSQVCWIGSDAVDEKPSRQVKLGTFLIDTYEVTNEEYAAFVAATGRPVPAWWPQKKVPKGRERHPVVMVSWEDSAAYAAWTGKRLPTAEEWEVAARGPDRREFPWGGAFVEQENAFVANCLEFWQARKTTAPGATSSPGTTAVDAFDASNGESFFRVHGMGGNVWEWTASPAPGKPEFRIMKGGSFMTGKQALRCSNVMADDPRLSHPDVGFRCARDLK